MTLAYSRIPLPLGYGKFAKDIARARLRGVDVPSADRGKS